MLRSFPKGSSPGPTGTRASHILHAVQVLNQTSSLDTLTDFMNHLASGLVPKDVQPFLAGAYLIGLSKKDGGIRQLQLEMYTEDSQGNACPHLFSQKQTFFFFLLNAFVLQVVVKLWCMPGDK